MCLVISSPTASINKVETGEDGKLICTNTSRGSIGREIYYTVHAILFFIIPLIYMIATQRKIFRSLRANVIPMCNSHIINTNQRHKKVAKTLAALSLAFFSCQSPFMILRLLMCFNLVSPGLVWRAAQIDDDISECGTRSFIIWLLRVELRDHLCKILSGFSRGVRVTTATFS